MEKQQQETLFTKHFIAAMVLFLIMIAVQALTFEFLTMETWLQVIVTIVPVAPLIWAFFIFRSRYQALDEYMKALTGEAFLWMIGIICFASFIYGMLAMKFSVPPVNLAFVMPVVFGGHGLILQLLIWKDNE